MVPHCPNFSKMWRPKQCIFASSSTISSQDYPAEAERQNKCPDISFVEEVGVISIQKSFAFTGGEGKRGCSQP